jgi:tripartite-type tricarboxylate transporter receptor subunit TctC
VAVAQANYPARPVKIIVPSAPGGGTDTVARLLSQSFSDTLGGSFVIDNRPGAGSMTGTEFAAHSMPDGYTLLVAASTVTSLHVTRKEMRYDVTKDFDPISMVVALPNVIVVNPSLPVKNLADLISLAKESSEPLSYASPGIASNAHMSMELLSEKIGVKFLHVPYNGVAPALIDVLAGRVPLMLVNLASAKAYINDGKLRPIAITTLERSKLLPDVPTVSESGVPGYESVQWFGLLAPKGIPPDVVQKLNKATSDALKTQSFRTWINSETGTAVGNSPQEFSREIDAEFSRWTEVATSAGITKN